MRVLSSFMLLLLPALAGAQTVTATWDANGDAYTVGYRLFYGTAPGAYQWMIDTGPSVSAPVLLSPGLYYFAVRAYNDANEDGPPSAEVAFDLRPVPTVPTCSEDALDVTVLVWPTSKKVQIAPSAYVSDYPIASRPTYESRGLTVNAITFTDTRGCTRRVPR